MLLKYLVIPFVLLIPKVVSLVHPLLIEPNIQNETEELPYRLPNNTRPLTYDIAIRTWIHEGNFTFIGSVIIEILTSNEPGSNITLHYKLLTIVDVKLWYKSYKEVKIQKWQYITEREFFVIELTDQFIPNTKYTLMIEYRGILRNDARGFYRSSYIDEFDVKKWLATTYFELDDARHGFPCYDEPALKAPFKIRITHDSSYSAISNMPETNSSLKKNADGSITTEFLPTPPTSTYLVAFIISDFKYTEFNGEFQDIHTITQRVFGKPTHINQTYLALNAGAKYLNHLAKYLNVPYSLPKLDQIAIPDFNVRGMENWGLVTYRESHLYWNESTSTYLTKTNIISIIAHELAHQWFGDLVGPQWWTYFWLNEGFATLFEFMGTDMIFPEWHYTDFLLLNGMQEIFKTDELTTTAPITDFVLDAKNIPNIHYIVSYKKAGCILRMFLHAFSESSFKKGMNYYLNSKAFSSAIEEDVFNAFERAVKEDGTIPSHYNVSTLMTSWTRQSGFPVLQIERNYNTGCIELTQKRYLTDSLEEDSTSWYIPFNFLTANDSVEDMSTFAEHWFPQYANAVEIHPSRRRSWSSDDWIIFNKNHTGYYRVKYDERNYNLIIMELGKRSTRIPYLSRAQIIDDAFSFVELNQLNYSTVLDLTKYLHMENGYIPWATAIKGLEKINKLLGAHEDYKLFQKYMRTLTDPIYLRLGFNDKPDESHQDKYLRSLIVTWSCLSNSKKCIQEASSQLQLNIRQNTEFHQNVLPTAYCAGLRQATDDIFEAVWLKRFNRSTDSEYRKSIGSSLGCNSNSKNLVSLLNSILNSTNNYSIVYQENELLDILKSVYENSQKGLNLTVSFLVNHFDEIYKTFKFHDIKKILKDVSSRIVDENTGEKFTQLINEIHLKSYVDEIILQNVLGQYKKNINWLNRNANSVFDWLKSNKSSANRDISSLSLTVLSILFIVFNQVYKIDKYVS